MLEIFVIFVWDGRVWLDGKNNVIYILENYLVLEVLIGNIEFIFSFD